MEAEIQQYNSLLDFFVKRRESLEKKRDDAIKAKDHELIQLYDRDVQDTNNQITKTLELLLKMKNSCKSSFFLKLSKNRIFIFKFFLNPFKQQIQM